MNVHDLLKTEDGQLLRVLSIKEDKTLVIDCVKRHMPEWRNTAELNCLPVAELCELCQVTGVVLRGHESLTPEERKVCRERYTVIAPILPFITEPVRRTEMILTSAEQNSISDQTVRRYLCLYLSFLTETVLAPKVRKQREMTADEKNMRWALNRFYYTKRKNTLMTAYTSMLRERYTADDGTIADPHPSIHSFRRFYKKNRKLENEYISREGKSAYQRNRRPLLCDHVQEFAPAPGTGLFDSTLADIYLVDSEGRITGRPYITICVDAFSSMILGVVVTMDNSVDSLRLLLSNILCNKVSYCKKKGIETSEEAWTSGFLPGAFLTDNGMEYTGTIFDQVTDLGVTLTSLPPYRPELKGVCEKAFDILQSLYKPQLKGMGVVEADYQERGATDYRKEACLTIDEFEKILLRCVIYVNTKRIVDFPFPKEMLRKNIKPFAADIFRFGTELAGANLIEVTQEELRMTLLPRTKAKFTRKGLIVNSLRYKAKTDGFKEDYLKGGECVIAYDPSDVGTVWLLREGIYTPFILIEKLYNGMTAEEAQAHKNNKRQHVNGYREEGLRARIDIENDIRTIARNGYERRLRKEEKSK